MTPLLQRLRERNLFQWALAYLAGAWIVFQGIEMMAEPWGLSAGFQRTVHLLVALGFLVALVLAWYHGEQGRQRVSAVELLIIVLLLAAGALLARMYRPEQAAAPETPQAERPADGAVRSLAVLPLRNLMGDPEQAYFVDGLHDILIGELAGISELTVISRTSVMRFRDTDRPMGEIAEELNVDALVEGSVFRSGDTVRINIQLIRGSPEEHLWQDRYEGRLSEALGLQTRVAEAIAREIRLALSPRETERLARRTEVDPAAQEAYLRGRALWRTRSLEAMRRALPYLEEAVAADSTFALAWSGLADAYTMGANYGALDLPRDEAYRRSGRGARRPGCRTDVGCLGRGSGGAESAPGTRSQPEPRPGPRLARRCTQRTCETRGSARVVPPSTGPRPLFTTHAPGLLLDSEIPRPLRGGGRGRADRTRVGSQPWRSVRRPSLLLPSGRAPRGGRGGERQVRGATSGDKQRGRLPRRLRCGGLGRLGRGRDSSVSDGSVLLRGGPRIRGAGARRRGFRRPVRRD